MRKEVIMTEHLDQLKMMDEFGEAFEEVVNFTEGLRLKDGDRPDVGDCTVAAAILCLTKAVEKVAHEIEVSG